MILVTMLYTRTEWARITSSGEELEAWAKQRGVDLDSVTASDDGLWTQVEATKL